MSTAVKGIYLYEDACMALGLITEQFPVVGDCAFIETENKVKNCMASELPSQFIATYRRTSTSV